MRLRKVLLWAGAALGVTIIGLTIAVLTGVTEVRRQVIPVDVPPGTGFEPLDTVQDWQIEPVLRLMRDPERPNDGIVGVRIDITSKAQEPRRNIQAAVWLPEGLRNYTPLYVIGTNLERWHEDLTPAQPGFIVGTRIWFTDFNTRSEIRAAFNSPTRVKLIWDGGVRYIEFPGSLWQVEEVTEQPPGQK